MPSMPRMISLCRPCQWERERSQPGKAAMQASSTPARSQANLFRGLGPPASPCTLAL